MSLLVSICYYKRIRQITPIRLCSMNWVGSGNLSDCEELVGGQSQVCLIPVDLAQLLLWLYLHSQESPVLPEGYILPVRQYVSGPILHRRPHPRLRRRRQQHPLLFQILGKLPVRHQHFRGSWHYAFLVVNGLRSRRFLIFKF